MNYVGKLFSNVKGFYNEINSATLTGALDVVVVAMSDGSFQSSPFHVRFGKLGVLRAREKVVDIECNGEAVQDLHMKLGEAGEAFFVEAIEEDSEIPAHLATSPLPDSLEMMECGIEQLHREVAGLPPEQTESAMLTNEQQFTTSVTLNLTNTKTDSLEKHVVRTIPKSHSMDRSVRRVKRRHLSEQSDKSETDPRGYSEMFDIELSDYEGSADVSIDTMKSHSMSEIEGSDLLHGQWKYDQFDVQHAFSDTDLTPLVSPVGSRPPTPKSDTEYETGRHDDAMSDSDLQWEWGELPERKRPLQKVTSQMEDKIDGAEAQGGLFQFMRKTKKIRHQPEQEGIYLSDLNLEEMDPEVASLYLYKGSSHIRTIKDEDNESGQGASLPHSPVSMEREEHRMYSPQPRKHDLYPYTIQISLCGGLTETEGLIPEDKFMQGLVTYDDFVENPSMLSNPNLVISINGKYYNWATAAPVILGAMAFQRPLPEFALEKLVKEHMPKKPKKSSGWRMWWGRGKEEPEDAEQEKKDATEDKSKDKPVVSPPSSVPSSPPDTPLKRRPKKDRRERKTRSKQEHDGSADEESDASDKSATKTQPETPEKKESENETEAAEVPPEPLDLKEEIAEHTKFKKTIRLNTEQLKKLNLKPGQNEITFSVTTQYQGTSKCTAYIYMWSSDDRIIISDIDGTITRSDVLGQLLPMVGKDWSQAGIANLYTMIAKNGYKFVYLSARAIGQSKITRDYLRSIRQGEDSLPEGPLLLSPSSLITAFHKEVIERKPEEFKISCLRDVRALFPSDHNPFYSGFGNKINDVLAYRTVGVPVTRIFTVNHRGELKLELMQSFNSSYIKLSDIVDHFFPPLVNRRNKESEGKVQSGNFHAPNEYSTFTYWREPLPDIEIELETFGKAVEKR